MTTRKRAETETLEARYRRYRSILKDLTIMSDVFMRNVLKQKACTEYILRVILERNDLIVVDQVLQKDYKNLQGRSAILDCVVRDSAGRRMNVEFQQEKEGAEPKRARYHSGLMDMNALNPGQEFCELPESYVSSGIQEDTELGRLMHDLHCKNAADMHSKILADRVRELKETQEGEDFMCRELEQIYSEGMEDGEKRGELRKARETALSMADDGMNLDKIAKYLKVNLTTVQEWLREDSGTVQ